MYIVSMYTVHCERTIHFDIFKKCFDLPPPCYLNIIEEIGKKAPLPFSLKFMHFSMLNSFLNNEKYKFLEKFIPGKTQLCYNAPTLRLLNNCFHDRR